MRSAAPASLPKGTHEIIKDRLYFTSFRKTSQRRANPNYTYFTIDNTLKYQPFFADFGPLNLGLLYRFCCILSDKLADAEQNNKVVVYYCRTSPQYLANAAYLIGSFQVICMNKTAEEAYAPFANKSFVPFRDASMGHCSYPHTVQHCLEAVENAKHSKFLDFNTFCLEEYEYYERVECGDFNIIVPDKFLAFSGPSSGPIDADGYAALTPAHYVPIFGKLGVTTIIRLNRRCYDRRKFTAKGFTHYDLIYPDGTIPPPRILDMFMEICAASKGIVAVHCKAGLGRTGTLIACYMMRYCGWNARECIAWIRICRPGSVIGPQQYYLLEKEAELMAAYRNDQLRKQLKGDATPPATTTTTITTPPPSKTRQSRKSGRMERDADGVWRRVPAATTTTSPSRASKDKHSTPTDLDFGDEPYRPFRSSSLSSSIGGPGPPPTINDLSDILMNSRISSSDSVCGATATSSSTGTMTTTTRTPQNSIVSTRIVGRTSSSSKSTSSKGAKSKKKKSRGSLSIDIADGGSSGGGITQTSPSVESSRSSMTSGLRPDQISQGRYLMNAKHGIHEKLPSSIASSSSTRRTSTSSHRSSSSSSSSSRPVPLRATSLTPAKASSLSTKSRSPTARFSVPSNFSLTGGDTASSGSSSPRANENVAKNSSSSLAANSSASSKVKSGNPRRSKELRSGGGGGGSLRR